MVSQAIHDLGVAKQSAEGTAAAAAAYRTRVTGGTVRPTRVVNDLEETTRDRLRESAYVSTVGSDGTPGVFARPASLGLWLYLAMGAKAVSGAGDPWRHVFTLANLLPHATVWRMLGDLVYERHVDCKVGQLVLRSEAGGPLRADLTIVGKKPIHITSSEFATEAEAAAVDTARPFYHYDGESNYLIPARSTAITLATSAAADDILDATAHGLAAGDIVIFRGLTGGAGLTAGRPYYVIAANLAANTFQVSETPGGSAALFTTDITAGEVVEMAAITTIRSQTITINNNASRWQGDALYAEDIPEGQLGIMIDTEQRVDAQHVGVWNKFHYGSESPAANTEPSREVVELDEGGLSFRWTAQASPERSLQVLAPRLQIKSIEGFEPGTGQEPLVGRVQYQVYTPDSGSGLTAVLHNGVSAY